MDLRVTDLQRELEANRKKYGRKGEDIEIYMYIYIYIYIYIDIDR